MTWYTEHFYHLPAEPWSTDIAGRSKQGWQIEASVTLEIHDGWRIRLDMGDCLTNYSAGSLCGCENDKESFPDSEGCGHGPWMCRDFRRDDFLRFRDAVNKAAEYIESGKMDKDNADIHPPAGGWSIVDILGEKY